jgi:transposase
MNTHLLSSEHGEASIKYVCGIDIGSQSCSGCIMRPKKEVVVKPITFANSKDGWKELLERLSQLEASPDQIAIGIEATSRYHENLYEQLKRRGYQMRLLHPGQTHQFHLQQGLRAKTDRLDALTIARVILSGEERAGYHPNDQIATYREAVRLHTQVSEEVARYQNQIQALVVVLFPEFTQVFADPCLPTALAVRNRLPSRPGDGAGGSGGSVSGLASSSCDSFWPPHRREISEAGSGIRKPRSCLEWTCEQFAHSL